MCKLNFTAFCFHYKNFVWKQTLVTRHVPINPWSPSDSDGGASGATLMFMWMCECSRVQTNCLLYGSISEMVIVVQAERPIGGFMGIERMFFCFFVTFFTDFKSSWLKTCSTAPKTSSGHFVCLQGRDCELSWLQQHTFLVQLPKEEICEITGSTARS